MKHRMIEAFTIERRIPDRRVGPAIVKGAWAKIDTTDSFADRVYQGELAARMSGTNGRVRAAHCPTR